MPERFQLYSLDAPNGQKVGIALEEMDLKYDAHVITIMKGDQFKPEFLAIAPNNKIPAMVDTQGPDGKPIDVCVRMYPCRARFLRSLVRSLAC